MQNKTDLEYSKSVLLWLMIDDQLSHLTFLFLDVKERFDTSVFCYIT
ncbi:MAG: hypothetical protein K0S30_1230 [Clostridia bacterium]|jgi:hypothetical protein|nr:hypothetical protein [Clostridia bacterium]